MVIDDIWNERYWTQSWKGRVLAFTIHLRVLKRFFSFGGGVNFWFLIMKVNVINSELNSTEVFKGKVSSDLGHQKFVSAIC